MSFAVFRMFDASFFVAFVACCFLVVLYLMISRSICDSMRETERKNRNGMRK